MDYITFNKRIKSYQASNFKEKEALGGTWRGKCYEHILKVKTREDLIWEYNVLPCVQQIDSIEGRLLKGSRLHQCAHHLNSSQMLCYNFFRPFLLAKDGHAVPKPELRNLLLQSCGVTVSENTGCEFESASDFHDRTNYDLHIKDTDGTEVFFEIKYTEPGFGSGKNDPNHNKKLKEIYLRRIEQCTAINKKAALVPQTFLKHYQMFRNSLGITGCNKHAIFIFPKDNSSLKKEAEHFKSAYLTGADAANVHFLTWEEILALLPDTQHKNEFVNKYFGYK